LTAHPSGRWCKKIKGRTHYFGQLADPDAALEKWLKEKDELLAGRVPRDRLPEGIALRDLCNAFLRHKQALMNNGELSPRTFADSYRTCANLIEYFGRHRLLDDLRQDDFASYRMELAKRLGPIALGNEIQRVRSVFKFALECGLATAPTLYGPGFKRPSKKTLRLERAKSGAKLFTSDELRTLVTAAGIPLKAMVLLACNAGLGNSDLASMPLSAVDLESGWVDYPRVKTGVARRFPLWPETIKAIRAAIEERPTPKDEANAGLLFITKYGGRWCKGTFEQNGKVLITENAPAEEGDGDKKAKPTTNNDNEITKEFNKLFAGAGLERKVGRSFYVLRHIFETVAGESRDQVAVDHIMGHARDDMASVYRERVGDDRLKSVVMHVHAWLFPKKKQA
jgi:integrase